jgi:hypothetical protein
MFEEQILKLQKKLEQIEEKLETDEEYQLTDEFEEEFESIKVLVSSTKTMLAPPSDNASEERWEKYDDKQTQITKCERRIRKIEQEYELDSDDDWMFDKDKE